MEGEDCEMCVRDTKEYGRPGAIEKGEYECQVCYSVFCENCSDEHEPECPQFRKIGEPA